MRPLAIAAVVVGMTVVLAACNGKSSSNSAGSASPSAMETASAGASPAASETTAAGSMGAAAGASEAPSGVPIYPGAVSQGSASFNGGANANGSSVKTMVLTTSDPFDKVYAFYQKSLPGAMEMMHTSTPPTPGAAFVVTDPNNKEHSTTVVISTATDGKVTISIQTSQSNQQ